jgi:molybdenum cofactor cytidylyltransferase
VLAAVVLAGGESRRMGSAKALLPYNHHTFVEHLVEVTQHPRVGAQRVVVGAHAKEIRERAGLDPAIVIENPEWQQGQLSSIKAAIRSLEGTATEGMLLALVDHPLISSGVISSLIRAFDKTKKPIVLPVFNGKRGHPVIFASGLYQELLAAPLDTGARVVVWNHSLEIHEVPTDEEGVIMNLNDPDAFRRAVESPA